MNRWNRQFYTLKEPDLNAFSCHENGRNYKPRNIRGYMAYCELHGFPIRTAFYLLEYEKEKNAKLRKTLHEYKQKNASLRKQIEKLKGV